MHKILAKDQIMSNLTRNRYLSRHCPCCDSAPPANNEVATSLSAESSNYEDLISQWNGFYKTKSIFGYARCKSCGLLFAPIFFNNEQLGMLYEQMPPNMDEVPVAALKATQSGYFRKLKEFSDLRGVFVEIGPDVGYFTENCVSEGGFTEFWLLEPNKSVADSLKKVVNEKKHHIVHDMDGISQIPQNHADAVVMVHVLDHLLDPISELTKIRKIMKSNSRLVIVTHDESSLLRRLTNIGWPAFCLQHPQIYNKKSIEKLLNNSGFDVLEISKTVNHFEIGFLLKHALWILGIKLQKPIKLFNFTVGLKLGNILTVATPTKAE